MVEHRMTVAGHRTRALELEGDGPGILLLHGWGDSADTWRLLLGELSRARRRALAVDLPGFGTASKLATGPILPQLDAFAAALVDRWGGGEPLVIAGNSLGGAVALRFAVDHLKHVEKLVLMAPGGIENQPDYFLMPAMATMKEVFMSATPVTEQRLRYFFEEAMVVDKKFIDDQLVRERFELMKLQNPQVIKTMKVPNMADRLGEITCPALGFWGMDEKLMPETGILKLAKGMPNMRMILVPKAGHWVMIEHRDLFNRMTLDFLKNG
jgi:4,5:9,10-diseco-3-hydroxy-5,9,17-trioxoandrosta-1(10),2-diene-4-oate hydrolase